jgi:deazaflavin-dependent oxidoreductase (nitroreductase family)
MMSVEHQAAGATAGPRFGGVLWRLARATDRGMKPAAGKRWNPLFALVEHRGRKSGRVYTTPVAARRVSGGFVISLSFGTQVDWHRNLVAARGGSIRWRGRTYRVAAPQPIDPTSGIRAFNPIQRLALRLGRIDHYIQLRDADGPVS